MRESAEWGGGVRARDPESRSEAASCGRGLRGPQRESARRRPSEAVDPNPLDSRRVKGKECTRSDGCGGGLGDRGGATPRGVELVESEGRCESPAAEYWEREGGSPARKGQGNAFGRASSAGLAGERGTGARETMNADSTEPQTEAIPCRASASSLAPRGSFPRERGKDSASWASPPSPGARTARPSENTMAPGSG